MKSRLDTLRAAWRARSPRERSAGQALAAFVGLAVLAFVWFSLEAEQARLQKAWLLAQARLLRMQDDAAEVARLRAQPGTQTTQSTTADAINASLRSRHLDLAVTADGSDRFQIHGNAAFDETIAWLAAIHSAFHRHHPVAYRLPGSLVDTAVDRLSDGSVRLTQAENIVWQGSGTVMVADPETQRWLSWLSVAWHADFSHLWRGVFGWRLTSGGEPLAEIEIGPGGLHLTQVRVRGPARFFLDRIPNVLGRGGGEGDVAIDSPGWHCSWSTRCDGSAELRWYGARSKLLPTDQFGDYRIAISSKSSAISAHIDTIGNGEVHIDGDAQWVVGGTPDFTGTLRGNPVLLSRLPSIAGNWARSGSGVGVWLISRP